MVEGKKEAKRHGMLTGTSCSMKFLVSVLLYAHTVMSLSEGEKSPAECRVHKSVITPAALKAELPADAAVLEVVSTARNAIRNILDDKDDRLLVIVGPCSIHDPKEAMEYAARLASFSHQHSQHLVIVMRTYFEKPRTRLGWKGLINDPALDGTFDMALGLRLARKLLLDINKLGLPCATEFLDPLVPSYISDLIAWGSTGARTVYSQVHREMTSGLEMPVGMKHDVFGNVDAAIDSLVSAAAPHAHLAMNQAGSISQATTAGNTHAHLVLRGGTGGSNYDLTSITRYSVHLLFYWYISTNTDEAAQSVHYSVPAEAAEQGARRLQPRQQQQNAQQPASRCRHAAAAAATAPSSPGGERKKRRKRTKNRWKISSCWCHA